MTADERPQDGKRLVLVTGPSGAGRTTAIKALEAMGFEVIDNLPLSLMPNVLQGNLPSMNVAIGIDVRNRDFSTDAVVALIEDLVSKRDVRTEVLFLDCSHDVLVRRYSETRHVHPLAPSESPDIGIAREIELLEPVRERADVLMDTSDLSPHDLRAEIEHVFGNGGTRPMALSIESFSYKRGLPRGVDMVFDVRFLANPHWEPELRARTGLDPDVAAYVGRDERFDPFFSRVTDLVRSLIPAFKDEGKSYLTVAFGCTGGKHRSVAVAEKLALALAEAGWQVSTRHRELERRGHSEPSTKMGTSA